MFYTRLKNLMNEFKNGKFSISELEEKIKEIATEEFYNQETQIANVWSIEDVKCDRPDLTDEECLDVLQVVLDEHDANIGINWTVLQYYEEKLYPTKKEDEENE